MGLLNIGVSGLLASQSAINTTGHNIANANVEGYSRQEVVLQTRAPQFENGGFIGNGVESSQAHFSCYHGQHRAGTGEKYRLENKLSHQLLFL